MALVRVFLTTHRRPHLLRRAVQSLLRQTFVDWICDVRNDAPDDDAPAAIVREAADPRLRHVRHARNLGAVALFNQVFSAHPEPFVALLEDDNWWEPDFLRRMVAALEANPDVTVAWSNQRIWAESANGAWQDTGRLVRPASASAAPVRVHWPQPQQCMGAMHANGAMLLRSRPGQSFTTPDMEFGGTEALRERSLPHPLLYVPEPLAVFSLTHLTHRSRDHATWATYQVLLAATFMKHVEAEPAFWDRLWADARAASPRMTGTLLFATRQDSLLRHHAGRASAVDWQHLALRAVRRPLVFARLLRARAAEPVIWDFLERHSAARAAEARIQQAGAPAAVATSWWLPGAPAPIPPT